jgi:Fe-S cluster assembly iron-binding protein IscA
MKHLTVTPAARSHFIRLLKAAGENVIELKAKSSGCNGYEIDYVFKRNATNGNGCLIAVEMSVPQAEPDGPIYWLHVNDSLTAVYLDGGTVDYVRDGLNYKLTYDLPAAKGSCGCGKSFNF